MITIRLGKIFCERYNKENCSHLTPKEIFRTVVAPVVFGGKEPLYWLTNSTFMQPAYKNKPFEEVLDVFCSGVEKENCLMTTLNVFGGCADYINTQDYFKPQSTTTNYNTNIYYTIDERYYSFIGITFLFNMCNFSVAICNEDLIWDLWEGVSRYRNAIDGGTFTKGKQLLSWNTVYITNKHKNDDCFISKTGDVDTKFGNLYTFLSIIFEYGIDFFDVERFGLDKGNITSSSIFIDVEKLRKRRDILKQCFVDDESKEFDYNGFSECFSDGIFFQALKCGALTKKMFDPKVEWFQSVKQSKKIKNNSKNKYIEMITTKDMQENAIVLNEVISYLKDKTKKDKVKKDEYFDNVYNAVKRVDLTRAITKLMEICNEENKQKLGDVFDFVLSMKKLDDVSLFQCCILRYKK